MEKNKKRSKGIPLQLISIKETSFSIDTSKISLSDFNDKKLTLEFGFKVEIEPEHDIFILHLVVIYQYNLENDSTKILELTTESTFKVNELGTLVEIEKSKFQDKYGLLPILLGVSIGTSRGILIVKTSGTILSDHPLPVVNPTEICRKVMLKNKKKRLKK